MGPGGLFIKPSREVKRTAKYETRPLNRGKWRELSALVHGFVGAKDTFLRILGQMSAWHHLDKPKAFRNEAKKLYEWCRKSGSPCPVAI